MSTWQYQEILLEQKLYTAGKKAEIFVTYTVAALDMHASSLPHHLHIHYLSQDCLFTHPFLNQRHGGLKERPSGK